MRGFLTNQFGRLAPNVSQELTGDAARFAIDGTSGGAGNSRPG
jgi:hypothetical protein